MTQRGRGHTTGKHSEETTGGCHSLPGGKREAECPRPGVEGATKDIRVNGEAGAKHQLSRKHSPTCPLPRTRSCQPWIRLRARGGAAARGGRMEKGGKPGFDRGFGSSGYSPLRNTSKRQMWEDKPVA